MQDQSRRLDVPEPGADSPAGVGPRLAAFLVDALLSALVAGLFTAPELPRNWSLLVFVIEYVLFTATVGQTPGMRLARLRIVRVDRVARVGLWRAVLRTLGVVLLVPAVIWDANNRGVHDRLTQTAVVRA